MVLLFREAKLRNQMKSPNQLADRIKGFSGMPAGTDPFILILHRTHLPILCSPSHGHPITALMRFFRLAFLSNTILCIVRERGTGFNSGGFDAPLHIVGWKGIVYSVKAHSPRGVRCSELSVQLPGTSRLSQAFSSPLPCLIIPITATTRTHCWPTVAVSQHALQVEGHKRGHRVDR